MIAGVDEAGRGPLAGPVTVAAVILKDSIQGLDDSKKLTEKKRLLLCDEIKKKSLCWSVVHVSVNMIDQINIFQATMLGMQQAIEQLEISPQKILVDGNKCPEFGIQSEAIVGGDGKVAAISAASIIAKTTRDLLMQELDQNYPDYGFAQHKGYGTKRHLQAIEDYGPCEHHRRSFAPVRNLIQMELL